MDVMPEHDDQVPPPQELEDIPGTLPGVDAHLRLESTAKMGMDSIKRVLRPGRCKFTIIGTTPLVQCSPRIVIEAARLVAEKKLTSFKHLGRNFLIAENQVYRMPSGQLYMPGRCVAAAMREALQVVSARVGGFGTSLANFFYVEEAVLPIFDNNDNPVTEYETAFAAAYTDIGGRRSFCRAAPRIWPWKLVGHICFNKGLISQSTIQYILTYAGGFCGIGSWRKPWHGAHGRFNVSVEWVR